MKDRVYSPRNIAIVTLGSIVMAALPRAALGWGSAMTVSGFCCSHLGAAVSRQQRPHCSGTIPGEFLASGRGFWLPLQRNRVLDLSHEHRRGKKTTGAVGLKAQRLVPEQEVETEIKVKNSRFIGSIAHTPSVEAARDYIASLKQRYPDGRHHCYAFSIGHGSSVTQGMSDDGEPSGTAGRPMLAVLSGSGLGDCTVVVTRYFGGTKLGTGGLVKAYTEATQAAMLELSVVEKVERVTIEVTGLDYQFYDKIKGPVQAMTAVVVSEEFADDVSLLLSVEEERAAEVTEFIQEATSGGAQIEQLSEADSQ